MPYKTRTCPTCDNQFQPVNSVQKYCMSCKTSTCPVCGKVFTHAGPSARGNKYCSHSCYLKDRWDKNHHELITCADCGKVFQAPISAHRKYCSIKCASQGRIGMPSTKRSGEYIECEWCDKKVYRRPCEINRSDHLFCSQECSALWWSEFGLHGPDHPNWKGGYSTQAYSNGWKEARRAIIARSHGKCEVCGCTPERYEVHHIKPVILCSTPEEANQLANLVGVCPMCHRKEEQLSRWAFGLEL